MSLLDRFRRKKQATDDQTAPGGDDKSGHDETEDGGPPDSVSPGGLDAPTATDAAEGRGKRKGGVFSKLRRALDKTVAVLNTDLRHLFKEGRVLDDALLGEVYAVLVKTDMGAAPAMEIRDQLQSQFRGQKVAFSDVIQVAKERFRELLAQPEQPIELVSPGPTVVMVVGVNGSGKTTSIGKLAYHFGKTLGKKVVVGAGDTFRAAAAEQLTIWAERSGAEIVKDKPGSDPASVAFRAVSRAVESEADLCIVDTAGRLQSQVNLMQELSKIRRVIGKQSPEAPHEVMLVLDATAGQNGISQASGFSEAVQCTGIILAKLDGSAKGGVIIPIRKQFDLPVRYIGQGEQAEDLAVFNSDQFVDALFDDIS